MSHGRRLVYGSDWVNVWLDDVEIPGVGRVDHHVLTMPRASTASVVTDDQGRFLLMWRHRFITDRWGWEVPAGWTEPGEDPAAAIRREVEEETGWRPGTTVPLMEYDALAGLSNMHFHCFHITDCTYTGAPTDASESTRIEWVSEDDVVKLAMDGEIADGPSLTALSYYLGPYRLART
ncbi:NUDIX hydrolase [Streptacidiphilus sp. N1-3]|uniref:NUDIX hydrolase n=1 Tax=Streptacidiphilus alkalitolerans TaxID=3342712 RepID=A0ABV6X9H7_9ACTN